MTKHYEWLMHPLNIEYLQKPKPIDKLPFQQVWVIDNYLTPSIWYSWRAWRDMSTSWGRSNRVVRNDEIQHQYWGESIYHNVNEMNNWGLSNEQKQYMHQDLSDKRWVQQAEWKKRCSSCW